MGNASNPLPPYSVLMPVAPWESPSIVGQALVSLAQQSLPASQVVLSCDGPPPESLRECLEQVALPLEIVIGPGQEGVGPVLARGLQLCRHELVVRADADDVSLPQRCARQVSWMMAHPEILVLGSLINEFSHDINQPLSQRLIPIEKREIERQYNKRNPLSHPSVILRRTAILAVGNYRANPGFEDYDLWLRLIKRHGTSVIANLPEALVLARIGTAHLKRRHGWNYAIAEAGFFLQCGFEELLEWPCVIHNLAIRFPLRILPTTFLAWAMMWGTRRRLNRTEDEG